MTDKIEPSYYQQRYKLSPQGAMIMDMLMVGDIVTTNELIEAGVQRPYLAIKRLRSALAPEDVVVHARYSLGYWIDPHDKVGVQEGYESWREGGARTDD
jgi:hypothetical protein